MIGHNQLDKKDYELALQSYEKALDINRNIHGKVHPGVSDACHQIGVINYRLKDYDSALHWHPASAKSYYCIAECQCEMQDYDSALESCQQALDIRIKLFGQESEDTSDSYDQMELIRSQLKVCGSSLELVT